MDLIPIVVEHRPKVQSDDGERMVYARYGDIVRVPCRCGGSPSSWDPCLQCGGWGEYEFKLMRPPIAPEGHLRTRAQYEVGPAGWLLLGTLPS